MEYKPREIVPTESYDPVTGQKTINRHDGTGWHYVKGSHQPVMASQNLRASQKQLEKRHLKARQDLLVMGLHARQEVLKEIDVQVENQAVFDEIAQHELRGQLEWNKSLGIPMV